MAEFPLAEGVFPNLCCHFPTPFSAGDDSIGAGPLSAAPFVTDGEELIVSVPGAIPTALRNLLIRIFQEAGGADELARAYQAAGWHTAVQALERLGIRQIDILPASTELDCPESFFQFDSDKLLYAIFVADSFEGYDPECPLGGWNTDRLEQIVATRIHEAVTNITQHPRAPNEIFPLVIVHGVGRYSHVGLAKAHDASPHQLAISVEDLVTLSQLEAQNPLLLWQYAEARSRLRETAEVVCVNELDEFSCYRGNSYSYYMSDDEPPNLISFAPGGAGDLRFKAAAKIDRHAVPTVDRNNLVEVVRFYDEGGPPVYAHLHPDPGSAALYVEVTDEVGAWVVAEEGDAPGGAATAHAFVESTAYWLAQIVEEFESHAGEAPALPSALVVNLVFDLDGEPELGEPAIVSALDRNASRVTLRFTSLFHRMTLEKQNVADRALIKQLVGGLGVLAGDDAPVAERLPEAVAGKLAKNPQRRMILMLDARGSADQDPRELPRLELVSKADTATAMDRLGPAVKSRSGLPEGVVQAERRVEVLNHAVAWLYEDLCRRIREVSADSLLRFLLTQNERLAHEAAILRVRSGARVACFSQYEDTVSQIIDRRVGVDRAALASRFLIELVAANPPAGLRPMSMSFYRQLLALSALVTDYGMGSDLLNYQLATFDVSLLPSGRLGQTESAYRAAAHRFQQTSLSAELDFPNRPQSLEQAEVDEAALTKATAAEFGWSLDRLVAFLLSFCEVTGTQSETVAHRPVGEIVDLVCTRFGVPAEEVMAALDLFSLSERAEFLKPPSPYTAEDVYPWRFGRPLSYMRRPFVFVGAGSEGELFWGRRHLDVAAKYLVELCHTGRLRASSRELKNYQSKHANREGAAFNRRVAEHYESQRGLVVHRNLKRIGGRRIAGPQGDLGDIDVLVADPSKRRLLVVECKAVSLARTPYEVAMEIDSFFQSREGRRSVVEKHAARTKWIEDNLMVVLEALQQERSRRWMVRPLLVTEVPSLGPSLRDVGMEIVDFHTLRGFVEGSK